MDNEIWKDIEGYEGLYQVSNLGRVRSLDRVVNNGVADYVIKGRVLKQHFERKRTRHVKVLLKKPHEKHVNKKVHRLVAEAFLLRVEGKNIVNHIDGDGSNNNFNNLEWVTLSENARHMTRNLFKNGNFYANKEEIISEYVNGSSIKFLASRYKVSMVTISNYLKELGIEIRKGYTRKYHIDKAELIKDFETGLSYKELIAKYKMKYHTLAAYKHKYKKGEF